MVLVKSLIGLFVIVFPIILTLQKDRCHLLSQRCSEKSKMFVYVSSPVNWTNAQKYCRQRYSDLATTDDQTDHGDGFKYDMWIGLYQANAYSPWVFSDGSKSLFRPWYSAQPNNAGGNQFCVYTSLSGYWNDWDCADKLPFVCYTGELFAAATDVTPFHFIVSV
uniref:C-type lectin domain-containing protein n=1 Tax=Sinocyclocheilus rhinocerous TaxID=307959 RepID=A0A673HG96_9TELE